MRFSPLQKLAATWCVVVTFMVQSTPGLGDVYHARPKLVIILVIDQFRGDLLDRYRDDLKAENGFNLFLRRGAYFNDCMYGYANTKTAPGHATIGTGAYTDGHSIGANEWWDLSRNAEHSISSVDDERYRLVGTFDDLPAPAPGSPLPTTPRAGSSPRNLLATTIGDEVRLATGGASRVFGISLKDRAAILPSGQSANAAYWIDNATGRFVTSTYYMAALPEWVTAFNKGPRPGQAIREAGLDKTEQFYALVGRTPAANSYELDFAESLIEHEHLGKGPTTDVLTLSLSANDIAGHQMGPDSDSQRAMVQELDKDLDRFFTTVNREISLGNVVVAFTADHGIAPIPREAAQLGISAASLNLAAFSEKMNAVLNAKFNQGGSAALVMSTQELPYFALNPAEFGKLHVSEADAEGAFEAATPEILQQMNSGTKAPGFAEARLPTPPSIVFMRSRSELAAGKVPNTEFGRLIAHSYTDRGGWYVMMVPQAYQMETLNDIQTVHFSPWSYDRHVPLGFFGADFVPGLYREPAAPVDIAVTLANLLGVNRPSAAVGRVLIEALKPTH